MSANSVEVHVPADLPVADRRRQITHAAATAVDRIINQQKNSPDGLILTVHLESKDTEYPTFVVTATVPGVIQEAAPVA